MFPALTAEPDGAVIARAAPEAVTFQGRVYLDVLAALERAGIEHCVLRPTSGPGHVETGHDLDLLVDPERAEEAVELSIAAARGRGAVLWDRGRAGALRDLQFHAREAPGRHTLFGLDLHTAETCLGVPFLRARDVLSRATVVDGVRRAAPAQSACIDAFGPFLAGGVLPDLYLERLRRMLRSDPRGIKDELVSWFGARLARDVVRALELARDPVSELELSRLRRAILVRALARSPVAAPATCAHFLWAMSLGAWLRPRGRLIAFLGTDGSGKSTLADAVEQRLVTALGAPRVATFHFRPGLLPQLDALVHGGRTTRTLADQRVPHRAAPSGTLGSVLRALYYALDWTCGYAWRVLPRRRRSAVVLFDRYADDYLVDPRRSRIRPGTPLLAAIVGACPRPDRVVVCTSDLETVWSRKQELELAETRRQLAAYEELAASKPRTLLVDTGASLDACVDSVLEFVFAGERR